MQNCLWLVFVAQLLAVLIQWRMASLTSAFLQGVDLQCPAMDDDSQDELINKNAALGKGKKQSLALLSETGKCSLSVCARF